MDMRLIRAGDIEANRLGAGREEQIVELEALPVRKHRLPSLRVYAGYLGAKPKIYVLLFEVLGWTQWHPIFRGVSGKVILGAIGPVVRGLVVGAQHGHAAGKLLAPEHLGGGETRRAPAHDHDAVRSSGDGSRLGTL